MGKNNINLTSGLYTGRWIQPKFRRRRKDNKQVSEYFRFYFTKPCSQNNLLKAGLMQNRQSLHLTTGFYVVFWNSQGNSLPQCHNPDQLIQLKSSCRTGIARFLVDWNQSLIVSPSEFWIWPPSHVS